ncbi:MAG TPA: GDSL-type esterase/lipase family protein [Dongiaceae bacterium]|nr:GDSL-type esterase/lipase family protein [Dongiaceae bacterium]
MKKALLALILGMIVILGSEAARAQTNAAAAPLNTALLAEPRTDWATNRQELVLQRAKDNPGACDIVFIGDSITEGWEGAGRNVWHEFYGTRKCLNFGVGGDRTQHVLWRYAHGQLDGLKPKVAVIMIGTNNSNGDDNSAADILAGVRAIVEQTRNRLPQTKILLIAIFPRGETFSVQRGKILQVNQALEKLDDGKNIFYIDFGAKLIEPDGSISRRMMHDFLHPGPRGYQIWADAMEPKIKELLGE